MKLFANGITNTVLAQIMSIEFLGGAIVSIFLVGTLWANISGSIAEAQQDVETNKESLVVVQEDLGKIKTEVALIRQGQNDYIKSAEKVDEFQTQELRDIKALLMNMTKEQR